jgi:hypothetical protein
MTLMDFSPPENLFSLLSLAIGIVSALIIAVHLLAGNRQHMWIMNIVWPITGLYFGVVAIWAYFKWGRQGSHRMMAAAREQGMDNPARVRPFWQTCFTAATHCGSGCTLGDLIAEIGLGFSAVAFTLFGHKLFGGWVVDFALAFLLGIGFQYFTIQPMRHLPTGVALKQALKADTLSILAWEIGMFGWMAIATFVIVGHEIHKTSPVYWCMMQIAMWCGFITSWPVNGWLLKRHIKEPM